MTDSSPVCVLLPAYFLFQWEKIAALQLYPVPWTPQSGLLTEAMKLKRHEIHRQFHVDIDRLYKNVP